MILKLSDSVISSHACDAAVASRDAIRHDNSAMFRDVIPAKITGNWSTAFLDYILP